MDPQQLLEIVSGGAALWNAQDEAWRRNIIQVLWKVAGQGRPLPPETLENYVNNAAAAMAGAFNPYFDAKGMSEQYDTAYATGYTGEGGTGGPGPGPGQPPGNPNPPGTTYAAATPNYANMEAAYRASLRGWAKDTGFTINSNIENLIHNAAHAPNGGWSLDRFMEAIYDTKEFQQAFPGIFGKGGKLKYTPDQYISFVQQYQQVADEYNLKVTREEMGYLFRNNVTPTEARERFYAEHQLETNPELWKQWKEQLAGMGYKNVKRKDIFEFMANRAPKEWYNIWEQAQVRYGLQQAGINTVNQQGKANANDLNLGKGAVRKIAQKIGDSDPSTLAAGYAQLAKDFQKLMPLSRISGYGLTKQDLIELRFGGKRQAKVAEIVENIMASEELRRSGAATSVSDAIGQRERNTAY